MTPYKRFMLNFREKVLNQGQDNLSPKQKDLIMSTGKLRFPLSDL